MIRFRPFALRLWLGICLIHAGCSEPGTTPTDPPTPDVRTPHQDLVVIPASHFRFGANQQEFGLYVRLSTFRYPGMVDNLREIFVTPPKMVQLPSFRIDQFEVTNQQYLEFLQTTRHRPTPPTDYLKHWGGATTYPSWAEDFPVVWVSQEDADAYCHWQGGRLPSEEEWEMAARGTSGFIFPWGNANPTKDTANFMTEQIEPTGNRTEDRSPFDVYDMGGNVSELTGALVDFDGSRKAAVRGGNYGAARREMFTFRRDLSMEPNDRSETVGFRCAFPVGP